MPVRGLSDQVRLARLGKLRLGVKKRTSEGKEYPSAVDYFIPDGVLPEYVEEFRKVFGEQPKEIPIVFPTNRPEEWYSQWMESWKGGKLFCRGDGETADRTDFTTGERSTVPCYQADDCPLFAAKQCRLMARLQFIIPSLDRGLGIWEVDTSSRQSVVRITSAIQLVMLYTNGRIAGVPFRLIKTTADVTVEGKLKKVPVLDLVPGMTKSELAEFVARSKSGALGLLPEFRPEGPMPVEGRPEQIEDAARTSCGVFGADLEDPWNASTVDGTGWPVPPDSAKPAGEAMGESGYVASEPAAGEPKDSEASTGSSEAAPPPAPPAPDPPAPQGQDGRSEAGRSLSAPVPRSQGAPPPRQQGATPPPPRQRGNDVPPPNAGSRSSSQGRAAGPGVPPPPPRDDPQPPQQSGAPGAMPLPTGNGDIPQDPFKTTVRVMSYGTPKRSPTVGEMLIFDVQSPMLGKRKAVVYGTALMQTAQRSMRPGAAVELGGRLRRTEAVGVVFEVEEIAEAHV